MNWISAGAAGLTKGIADIPIKQAAIKEAKLKQQLAEQKLNDYKDAKPLRDTQIENSILKLRNDNANLNKQLVNNITRGALDRYDADKDIRHLNLMFKDLQNTEHGNKMFGKVAKIMPLTQSTENDVLLRQLGYADLDGIYDLPEIKENLMSAIGKDGEYAIWDLNKFKAMTGYTKYITKQKMDIIEKQAQIDLLLKKGEKASKVTAMQGAVEDLVNRGIPYYEAWQMVTEDKAKLNAANSSSNYLYNEAANNPNIIDTISKVTNAKRSLSTDEALINQLADTLGVPINIAAKEYFDIKQRQSGKASVYTAQNDPSLLDTQRDLTDATTRMSAQEVVAMELVDEGIVKDPLEAMDLISKLYNKQGKLTNEQNYVRTKQSEGDKRPASELIKEYKNLYNTSAQKNVKAADNYYKKLDKMDWLNKDITKLSNSEKAELYSKNIGPLEELKGFKLSEEEKRNLRKIGDLIQLGDYAGKNLTKEQTGLIDNSLGSLKKYLFENVEGTKAKSSYNTFSNTVRNALYGSSLTKNEKELYDKAAGTLNQQFGPVMQQLQVQLQTIKNNLKGITSTIDPYIAKYYTGISENRVNSAIKAIDERLNYVDGLKLNNSIDSEDVKIKIPTSNNTSEKFDFDKAMEDAGL